MATSRLPHPERRTGEPPAQGAPVTSVRVDSQDERPCLATRSHAPSGMVSSSVEPTGRKPGKPRGRTAAGFGFREGGSGSGAHRRKLPDWRKLEAHAPVALAPRFCLRSRPCAVAGSRCGSWPVPPGPDPYKWRSPFTILGILACVQRAPGREPGGPVAALYVGESVARHRQKGPPVGLEGRGCLTGAGLTCLVSSTMFLPLEGQRIRNAAARDFQQARDVQQIGSTGMLKWSGG